MRSALVYAALLVWKGAHGALLRGSTRYIEQAQRSRALTEPEAHTAPGCPSGAITDSSGAYCCASVCGTVCGGFGCDLFSQDCCRSQITASCDAGTLPCLQTVELSPLCPPGSIPSEDGATCCPASCGKCGGADCHLFLGGEKACCTSQAIELCTDNGGAMPCSVATRAPSPAPSPAPTTAPTAFPVAIESAAPTRQAARTAAPTVASTVTPTIARPSASTAQPTVTGTAEPTVKVTAEPTVNGKSRVPTPAPLMPGIMPPIPETPQPTAANIPTNEPTAVSTAVPTVSEATPAPTEAPFRGEGEELCSNGFLANGPDLSPGEFPPEPYYQAVGYCSVTVCCPTSCSKCDNSDICDPTVPDECCVHKIAAGIDRPNNDADTDVDVSCKVRQPPCVMPLLQNDPCAGNPCKNGAACGVEYASLEEACKQQAVCECSSIPAERGTFSGQFCEIDCSGTDACGGGLVGYTSTETVANDVCCSASEDCLRVASNFGYTSKCFAKARPKSCAECSTAGTNDCQLVNFYESDVTVEQIWQCVCLSGYEGLQCETQQQQ